MKILVVTQYFWPEQFRVNDLVKGLVEHGHAVTVLTGFPNYPKGRIFDGYPMRLFKREFYEGALVVRVPLYPDHTLWSLKRILNYGSFVLMASLLGPLLCKGRFDRIVVFQPGPFSVALPGILMKWISRSPLFIWVQDIWPDALEEIELIENPLVSKAIAFVAGQVYRRCDVLMVASEGYRERLQMFGIAPGKIKYLPQWAEEFYQVQDPDYAFGEREGMAGLFNVVFAGNIGLWQDMEVILDAADLLRGVPDILFVILGDGVKLEESIHYGKKKELPNVIFKGRKAGELMPQYFALAGALLLQLKASKAYSPMTIPAKLQTYFACGRPVIAAIKGAGAKVVEKAGAGIVCEPDDAKSLAEAVMQIYRSSIDDRQAMGRKAREYYDHHFRRELVLEHLDMMLKAS